MDIPCLMDTLVTRSPQEDPLEREEPHTHGNQGAQNLPDGCEHLTNVHEAGALSTELEDWRHQSRSHGHDELSASTSRIRRHGAVYTFHHDAGEI